MNVKDKIIGLKEDIYDLNKKKKEVIQQLDSLAVEVDIICRSVKFGKFVGTAMALTGGAMAVAGCVLSFFTLGASSGLTLAGGAVAAAGSVTTEISKIVEVIHSCTKFKEAEKALKEYDKLRGKIQQSCKNIGKDLERFGDVNNNFPGWVSITKRLVFGVNAIGKKIGWNVIANFLGVDIAKGISMGREKFGDIAAHVIGRNALGAAGQVVGNIAGVLKLPLNIFLLVNSAKEHSKNNPYQIAVEIRKLAKTLEIESPLMTEVEEHLEGVLERINHIQRFSAHFAQFI